MALDRNHSTRRSKWWELLIAVVTGGVISLAGVVAAAVWIAQKIFILFGAGFLVVVHTGSIDRDNGTLFATCEKTGYIAVSGACAADELSSAAVLYTAAVTKDRRQFQCQWRGYVSKARAQAICVNAELVEKSVQE